MINRKRHMRTYVIYVKNSLLVVFMIFLGHSRPSPNGYRDLVWEGSGSNFVLPYFTLFERDIFHNEGTCINMDEYVSNGFTLFKFSLGRSKQVERASEGSREGL